MNVLLNGRPAELADGATVRDAVVAAGAGARRARHRRGAGRHGRARARPGTTTTLHEDAQLEVLRATAGG